MACTTKSAAASIATPPTAVGWCPHFEKMLYDNALLARLYLHAFQATGDPAYRRVATEILDYVVREMTDSAGGFYSSQDADSEGEEGKFFVWTLEELAEVLGPEEGELVAAYFGASQVGNFEGSNILYLPHDADEFATAAGLSSDQLEGVVQSVREKLLEARETRVHPARDDKVLAGWNGLMLQAFAEAAAVLDRDDYRRVAIDNATFLLSEMRPDGRLLRSYKDGQARVLGYLEDYAFVADGLLYVYELTFDRQWINEARALADDMIDLFWDEDLGFFYETGKDAEQLVVRPRELFDNAIPCGGSMAAPPAAAPLHFHRRGELRAEGCHYVARRAEHRRRAPHGDGQLAGGHRFLRHSGQGSRGDWPASRLSH